MRMEAKGEGPEPKRRKILKPPPRRIVSSSQKVKDATSISSFLTVPEAQTSGTNFIIEQAKNFAVAQAQQDGCTGNFRIFDSQYGNFLVPLVPSRAKLTG